MARIKKIDETYNSIYMNIPRQIELPNYRTTYDVAEYFEQFSSMNSHSTMIEFYKANKPNMTPVININKYLIG